ncbi:MAG: hypothetical protein A2172_02460 [Candidatus Woykebacteria bacterium RBG_13_40_15]|uniref:Uncharacterized protein n=1 Tax=Candidatus Woykebacteria bacterium RBG_13_40_15 TaxID=1802593 RepID=A0A1G1W6D0_9BACT|nr:MAG: hypothetical protein A2172_02460 [Candidatus Woykebacteria bacterium RBG_13_40_15]
MKELILFTILIVVASFIQVSILALPIGSFVVLFWFNINKTKHLIFFATLFSLVLAIISDLPVFLVLMSTTFTIGLFAALRSVLPSKNFIAYSLLVFSAISWEAFLVASLRLINL